MLPKVTVLGSSGMLALGIQSSLKSLGIPHTVVGRSTTPKRFDAFSADSLADLVGDLGKGEVVINCVGLTKAHIDSDSIESRQSAIRVNSLFPNVLAKAAEERNFRVIQVATDCVFNGTKGSYTEESPHDAEDVYGMTKSLGESPSPNVLHLRCSLVGREAVGRNTLLYNWVSQQPTSAQIKGFTNHLWNGLTNQVFGRVVGGLIRSHLDLSGVVHLVPNSVVSKAELVQLIANKEGRSDIKVNPGPSEKAVNRTLSTLNPSLNQELFALAGYQEPPSVERMIFDLI